MLTTIPLIDIIVPTYNRRSDIKRFVQEIQKQRYSNYHIYIVDDCGEEEIQDTIPDSTLFTYTRLTKNKGQAYARNVAIEKGKGEILVSLDDDAWFDSDAFALDKIVKYFHKYPDMGCLMLNVKLPSTSYNTTLSPGEEIGLHITCGCAYTRKALKEIGMFNGMLHSGAEETDISLRLVRLNYQIRFAPDIKVFHNFQEKPRGKQWYHNVRYNTTRNDLLTVMLYYPTKYIPIYFAGKTINHIKFALTNNYHRLSTVFKTLEAVGASIGMMFKYSRKRKALTSSQFARWRALLPKY